MKSKWAYICNLYKCIGKQKGKCTACNQCSTNDTSHKKFQTPPALPRFHVHTVNLFMSKVHISL